MGEECGSVGRWGRCPTCVGGGEGQTPLQPAKGCRCLSTIFRFRLRLMLTNFSRRRRQMRRVLLQKPLIRSVIGLRCTRWNFKNRIFCRVSTQILKKLPQIVPIQADVIQSRMHVVLFLAMYSYVIIGLCLIIYNEYQYMHLWQSSKHVGLTYYFQ